MYELMGRGHAALVRERGQGTVEYVGLILLLAVLLAGVVKATAGVGDASIPKAVADKLNAAITKVGDGF